MKILFLDDEKYRHEWADAFYAGHEVHHAYTFMQFRNVLWRGGFDMVPFDHDIADSYLGKPAEVTGLTCAEWMLARRHLWPEWVHRALVEPFGRSAARSDAGARRVPRRAALGRKRWGLTAFAL